MSAANIAAMAAALLAMDKKNQEDQDTDYVSVTFTKADAIRITLFTILFVAAIVLGLYIPLHFGISIMWGLLVAGVLGVLAGTCLIFL